MFDILNYPDEFLGSNSQVTGKLKEVYVDVSLPNEPTRISKQSISTSDFGKNGCNPGDEFFLKGFTEMDKDK